MPIERANRIPEARSEVQNPEATKLGRPSSLKLRNKLRMNGKRFAANRALAPRAFQLSA